MKGIIITVSFLLLFIVVSILNSRDTDNSNNKKIIGICFLIFIIEVFVISLFFPSNSSLSNGNSTIKIPSDVASLLPNAPIEGSTLLSFIVGILLILGVVSLLKDRMFVNHATQTIGIIVDRYTKNSVYENVNTGAYENRSDYYVIVTFQDGEKNVKAKCRVREFLSTKHSNGMKIEIAYKKSLILRKYKVRGLESNDRPESRKTFGISFCVTAVIFIIAGSIFNIL